MRTFIKRVPKFNGKYNDTKGKCFVVLFLESADFPKPLTHKQIAALAERPYHGCRVDHWHNMKYLGRSMVIQYRNVTWAYYLTQKGLDFIPKIPKELFDKWVKEIEGVKRNHARS